MNLHRYKSTFTGGDSSTPFFELSTWIFGGALLCGLLMLLLPPTKNFYAEISLVMILLSIFPLFILKLFAQHFYLFGLVISVICGLISLIFIGAFIYFSFFAPIDDPIDLNWCVGIIYFGTICFVAGKEYANTCK